MLAVLNNSPLQDQHFCLANTEYTVIVISQITFYCQSAFLFSAIVIMKKIKTTYFEILFCV